MRRLLQFLALCAVVSLCVCYDSRESSESAEDLIVSRNRANAFIPSQWMPMRIPPRGNSRRKSPVERRAEICEDYSPCRLYSYQHGSQKAYERYFNALTQPQRPARTRLY
ncbi:Matrix Gla protein [Channa argus]|uniref:Matrix Gla protein n=1 Tax=Channa argus TaxID=215402 RepID=A0A6G1QEI5_CHAAH|nr:Matrix Gla protein [Channa argus]